MGTFDILYMLEAVPEILRAFWLTLALSLETAVLSILAGALLACLKLSGNRILRAAAGAYTAVIRCTPTIILLFLCYYGLPRILDPLGIDIDDMSQFWYCLIAFVLLNAAMTSEMIRSTYLSIDRGQFEAAETIGLTPAQTLFRIILPQGFYIALPNLGNLMIALLKETSLGFTIGLVDMMGQAKLLIYLRYGSHALETYLAMAAVYWALTILIERLEKHMESRFRFGVRNAVSVR